MAPLYRRPGRLWQALQLALGLSIVAAALAAAAHVADQRMIGRLLESPTSVSVDQVAAADDRRLVLGVAALLLFLLSAGLMIAWTRRLYGNLGALGVTDLRFGVGWAIGGWFVPFLNLVRPKQIVDDIWRASDPTASSPQLWHVGSVPGLLHVWWAVWIIGAVLRLGSNNEPNDLESLNTAMGVQAFGLGMIAVGGILTLVVVRQLTERQELCASARLALSRPQHRVPAAAIVAVPAALGVVVFGVGVVVIDGDRGAGQVSGSAVLLMDLQVGDCFDQPEALSSAADNESVPILGVDLVDCGQPHDSEIFALVEHRAPAGAVYPGDDELFAFADEQCVAAFEEAVGGPFADSDLQLTYLAPTGTWAQGDRTLQCAASLPSGGRLEATILGSETRQTPSSVLLSADEAHRHMVDAAVADGDLLDTEARCWADAVAARIDLTSADDSLDDDDRHLVFSSLFDCLAVYDEFGAGFAECMAEFWAGRTEGLSVGDVVDDAGRIMNAPNEDVFRAGVSCGDPTLDAGVIDCVIDGLEAEFPDVWTHPMRPEEEQHAATLFPRCIAGD